MSSSNDEVDKTIQALMEELEASTQQQPTASSSTKKKKCPEGWTVKKEVPNDSPTASWIDASGMQYTVRNPNNRGNVLLKMQVYEGGLLTHSCGLYVDEGGDNETCFSLFDLLRRVENMWVDRETGVPKTSGVTRIATPLAAWRQIPCGGGKRKKASDCTTSKKKKTM